MTAQEIINSSKLNYLAVQHSSDDSWTLFKCPSEPLPEVLIVGGTKISLRIVCPEYEMNLKNLNVEGLNIRDLITSFQFLSTLIQQKDLNL